MSKWSPDDDRGGPPEPGFYTMKLCRRGHPVSAVISCEDGLWSATINGEVKDEACPDPYAVPGVCRVWHYGHRATRAECEYLDALREWAKLYMPGHPILTPYQPIDVSTLAPLLP